MQAGLELDMLVTKHVMGIEWDESRCRICGWPLTNIGYLDTAYCTEKSCAMRPLPDVRADATAPYSTDIAAAWDVLEVLKTRGFTATIFVYGIGVQVRIESGGSVVTRIEESTAPLAICRAALSAIGIPYDPHVVTRKVTP